MPEMSSSIQNMSKEELLCHLLQKEFGYYLSILELTEEEHRRFEQKLPLKEIAPLLHKKKAHLHQISDIEKALSPLKEYWKEKNDRSDKPSQSVESELLKLHKLLKELLDLDLISQRHLENYIHALEKAAKETPSS